MHVCVCIYITYTYILYYKNVSDVHKYMHHTSKMHLYRYIIACLQIRACLQIKFSMDASTYAHQSVLYHKRPLSPCLCLHRDLSDNSLTTFPKNAFKDLLSLTTLWVICNDLHVRVMKMHFHTHFHMIIATAVHEQCSNCTHVYTLCFQVFISLCSLYIECICLNVMHKTFSVCVTNKPQDDFPMQHIHMRLLHSGFEV